MAKTGHLILEHDYPQGNRLKAAVDIGLLLDTLKSNETCIGEWISIIGYVKLQQNTNFIKGDFQCTEVQALVLWSSGPFNLQGYERSLQQQSAGKSAEKDINDHT
jgi:hypothetical protein